MALEPWGGAILKWPEDRGDDKGLTVWHVAAPDTWFAPSNASFMINYRVDDLGGLLANLRAAGVEILKGPESDDNGTFAWIVDPDGNKASPARLQSCSMSNRSICRFSVARESSMDSK
jgi:catechol 2,3-dioxygenase-like lactoylglutathione lyase family enzyme